MPHPRLLNPLSPYIVSAIAILLLTVMDAVVKHLATRYPVLQVTFLRFLIAGLIVLAMFIQTRTPRPTQRAIIGNTLRGFLTTITAASFFYAVSVLPLADTFVITYSSPIIMALAAIFLLGERPDWRFALALCLGFLGTVITLKGVGSAFSDPAKFWGIVAALGSSITYALLLVLLRMQARSDPPLTIVLFQTLIPAAFLSVPAFLYWIAIDPRDILIFVLAGGLGVIGHLTLTNAFARAEASKLAPVEYTGFIWAAMIGMTWFGEIPSWATLLGLLLIVGGCLVLRRPTTMSA
jgi:drug/metabolite transporter (DMT)-like permease